ncbi:MAG: DUF3604 domain-containing protein [Polyangiales bacterium]
MRDGTLVNLDPRMRPTTTSRVLCALIYIVAALLASCENASQQQAPEPKCADFNEQRNVYFGDLHAHTVLSYDANIMGTRVTQAEAYGFAKGGQIMLAAPAFGGGGPRPARLSRPLDFASLPEHSEYLAEVQFCWDEESSAYATPLCTRFRGGGAFTIFEWSDNQDDVPVDGQPTRFSEICEQPDNDCAAKAKDVWQGIVRAAEEATEACEFSAFPGYEYTRAPESTNMHRNIIFRDSNVIDEPLSGYDLPNPQDLYRALEQRCLKVNRACDVIAIPHNSNWSNGAMFTPSYPVGSTVEEQAELARLRAKLEPLVETYQVKGWMECRNGFSGIPDDPFCAQEKTRSADAPHCDGTVGRGGIKDEGCVSRYDFIRNVLKLGLSEKRRIGVNPYKLGVLGSTDTHSGSPGQVAEYNYQGASGGLDASPRVRVAAAYQNVPVKFNPGGLTAVWAAQNTRTALFDAMHRKEIYATTGTRLSVRFFGGWEYDAEMCGDSNFAEIGYERGVTMGSDLPRRADTAGAPRFAVLALKDEGTDEHPGPLLQRVQIVKGWVDSAGMEQERIYEVAGTFDNGASVDPVTCEMRGAGAESLCSVWSDPDFEPSQAAFYYARVLENPACSWRQYDCNRIPEMDRPDTCADPTWPKVVQDRAMTSPIWFTP